MKAKLHIQTTFNNGQTKLGNCYFSPPFKVMNITEDKTTKQLQLMLMSSSPGILDEDEYEMKIDVAANAALHLHTQSYQRLFNMQKGAKQLMEVHLQKGSSFTFLPHPSVPHKKSIFTTRNKIYLHDECSLVWGEILTCGRKLSTGLLSENGEVFSFSKYHSITEVFLNSKLIIKENLLMQPLLVNPNLMGQMEGFTHQASLILLNNEMNVAEAGDVINDFLMLQNEIIFGVSATGVNGLIIRILGYKAAQLHDCLKNIAALLQTQKPVSHAS